MTDDTPDEALVGLFLSGDGGAFGRLVERYRTMAYRLAYRMTGDHHAAEDLSQESFLRAHRSLPGFRVEASFRTWFLRIVANLCLSWRRDPRRMETAVPVPDRAGPAPSPASDFEQKLVAAIQELPEKQRLTLVLRVHEGLDFDRIAEIVGTSAGGARMNLSLARKTLRDRMAPLMSEARP